MMKIQKMRCHHTIDFAAEELKKYLRMMMPEGGDVAIRVAPDAGDGFRLGLLEDFSLPSEAEDPLLDDVVHIEAGPDGGILAGSNPRSVLFAVYRFLRLNGCRFLYPGIDGEFIPVVERLQAVSYHKLADMRFRGHCNEGSESQTCMLETIDFYAKQEINVYMLEFRIPFGYYNAYYAHTDNEKNRPPEPVSETQVLQWKRQCEAEIAKRGMMFHDIGHGWTADPFGFHTGDNSGWASGKYQLTEKQTSYLALRGGKRELYKNRPNWTNLCYSNEEVQRIMAQAVVEYAEHHQNVDYLHVWLADMYNNHCECEACRKMRPSDWYLAIMNRIDRLLTEKGLKTRIVFIAYVDTLFAPEKITIENPKRFSLLYAPIFRSYLSSINKESKIPAPGEYVRNAWKKPTTAEENFAHLQEWRKSWTGSCITYEYHFWRTQFYELGGVELARRIYEDVRGLKEMGLEGFIEDGSQRSFFPNGFAIYTYAEVLVNSQISFEELKEDYFSHIYGEDWQKVVSFLEDMGKAFDFGYLFGEKSIHPEVSKRLNPAMVKSLDRAPEIAAALRSIAAEHKTSPTRPQTVSYRLLQHHAAYCDGLSAIMKEKAVGNNYKASEMAKEFLEDFGRRELEIERYYDHGLAAYAIQTMMITYTDYVYVD